LLLVWQGLPQLAKRNLGQHLHPFRPLPQLVAVVAHRVQQQPRQSLQTHKRPTSARANSRQAKVKERNQCEPM
jgi:hypothetical protein